ncbi:FtsX-like permease family protein [Peptacetobacter sp.]|uniref:FtsX-like permease family protein n=2 Tax=Peptacetobacter TaxID=2743582 RepID=UPI002E75FF99|nr:FtsX-like permease family protein [Peptacetobacter sp.]MEE0452419.1 FtsX-like permease family protein [Peptacetobacter sp.]
MKIYRKLSALYMKKNKSRTLMMFIMVIATVAFMISIDMIKVSQTYNRMEAFKLAYGDYHSEYVDISKEKLEKVANDNRVEYRDTVQNLGFLINKDNGTIGELKSFDGENDNSKNYFDRKAQVLKGEEPKNNNEIVLDEECIKNFGIVGSPIGQTVSLELRKEYTLPSGEKKLYLENKKFKVVGIVKRTYKDIKNMSSTNIGAEQKRGIAYTYGDFNGQSIIPKEALTYDIILRFKGNELVASNKMEQLVNDYSLGRMTINPNSNYLSELLSIKDLKSVKEINPNNIVLIITVILLVFNMMNIIWSEYLREISMLRLIGARKRDIRFMVVYQSVLLAAFGTIIGIVLGLGITKLGLVSFKDEVLDAVGISPSIHIDQDVIMKTIKVAVSAIVLATIVPVIKIGKIGCMEAISNATKHKKREKQSKIGKLIQDKFGIFRYMGIRNLWIKKTRTFVSILTITLCGYLIIYTFSGMQNEVNDKIRRIYYKNDITVCGGIANDEEIFKIDDNKIDKIKNMQGVKSVKSTYEDTSTFVTDKKNIEKAFIGYYGLEGDGKIETENYLRFYDNEDLKKYVEPYMLDGKTSKELETKTDGYINVAVYNSFYDMMKTHTQKKIFKDLKQGDIINLNVKYHNGDKIEKRSVKVRVAAIIKADWQAYGDIIRPYKFEVITSEDNMKELLGFKAYNNLAVDYKDMENIEANSKVEEYVTQNIPGSITLKTGFVNTQNQEMKNIFRESVINITLVLMIAAISIFCTVKSNLMERRKEMFTMRALGMSAKDMNSMNMWESMTYAVLSVISGIALATYELFKFVEWNNNAYTNFGIEHFMDFTFPYPQVAIFAIVTLVTCIIAVKLANRDFKNREISDGMRDID